MVLTWSKRCLVDCVARKVMCCVGRFDVHLPPLIPAKYKGFVSINLDC